MTRYANRIACDGVVWDGEAEARCPVEYRMHSKLRVAENLDAARAEGWYVLESFPITHLCPEHATAWLGAE